MSLNKMMFNEQTDKKSMSINKTYRMRMKEKENSNPTNFTRATNAHKIKKRKKKICRMSSKIIRYKHYMRVLT